MRRRRLVTHCHSWQLTEPFVISRGSMATSDVAIVELHEGNHVGRSETVGVLYRGETPETISRQIESVHAAIEAGAGREDLYQLLPAGGARNALDCALWDLEAKLTGVRTWQSAGMPRGGPVRTAVTIGIRPLSAYESAARRLADHPWIKIKVGHSEPVEAVRIVRHAAPNARLVVDPNQAWSIAELEAYAPAMAQLKVDLLEQPVSAGADDGLLGLNLPIPICADEAVNTIDELPHLIGRYQFINIKLDKTGGLTEALRLAHAARAQGLRLMVGCMTGGSLAMAPAMVLAQICEVVDLDGPVLQQEDWPGGIVYERGTMQPPWPAFWG